MGFISLAACQALQPPTVSATATSTQQPGTPTLQDPTATITPTPEPAALIVNGEAVPLVLYEAELQRYMAAHAELNKETSPEAAREAVLTALTDEALLVQAAAEMGYNLSPDEVQSRLAQLVADRGGDAAFQSWLSAQFYTLESFERALSRSITAAYARDQIIDSVPAEMEQIHARQILLLDKDQAAEVYRRLQGGASFADLVLIYDPVTGGDIGWFPPGYLTLPELEEAAFALQPGEYTGVISTSFGYHILQVIDRKVTPLSPDALQVLRRTTLQNWLAEQRARSQVEVLLP